MERASQNCPVFQSAGTSPPVPDTLAARDMPRKELGMAGCNSGSCDSMISTASNHSQRLEETIGSLDAEADSGVSTDETDYAEPSKLPGMWPKRDPVPQDLGNGTLPPRGQQHVAEQKDAKSISASSSSAPTVVSRPGYHSLPRNIPTANGASDSKVTVHTAKDAVPADKSSQEMAKEDRLDHANTGSQMRSVRSLTIQPPDPFQDDLVDHEWSRSNYSDAKGERAKETKTWTSWGQPEKSILEETSQDLDAKRGPPTAPKPRKLPPNIILKTSKNNPVPLATEPNQKAKAPPPPSAASHPDPAAEKMNSGHFDPKEKEKVHQEALEKLGLLHNRRQPSVHLQPAPHPPPRETPCPIPGEPQAVESLGPGIRQITFKSNTLERSGVGLSSYITNTKEQNVKTSSSLGKMSFIERLAPSFLRSSRPRPVSLGAGKDFAALKESGQVEQEKSSKRRSHPLPSFPRPPRSCVSVKISPKGATDDNRREALKKLGLLKE
ncbi:PREDICTED: specifically androgen-regulated gene protein [Acanthisitta chloris]|uniref:specifically androgen-regulated gene protein n=1 Tax=Acanthisitta chloris TaxID=57068 RepID=UPI0004F0C85D|nr:PREDICTED: specifically androgen-regulated gene protein [Acanthisitta chloris]